MNGSKDILHDKAFIEQDSVFIVVAFPVHISDQDILTKRKLASGSARSICQYVTGLNPFTDVDKRPLVDACALIRTAVFDQLVILSSGYIIAYSNMCGIHFSNYAVTFSQQTYAGVDSALMLNSGSHNRSLSCQQGHCLPLHISSH